MNECYRVLKSNGMLEIIVPHEKSEWAWADPTHKHVFNKYSFCYFLDDEKYVPNALKIPTELKQGFYKQSCRLIKREKWFYTYNFKKMKT